MLSACASTESVAEKSYPKLDERLEQAQRLERIQDDLFGRSGIRLGIEEYDFAAVIYAKAFEGEFLIRLDSYPEMTFGSGAEKDVAKPSAALWIVDRHDRQERNRDSEDALHEITNIDTYRKEVTPSDFSSTSQKMLKLGLSTANPDLPFNGCIDGDSYLIVLVRGGNAQRLARHECDATYASDISFARPLFDLANAKVPETQSLVDQAWQEISTRQQD